MHHAADNAKFSITAINIELFCIGQQFATLCTTEDAHEGINNFLNERETNWSNKQASRFKNKQDSSGVFKINGKADRQVLGRAVAN